ncbi:MAG: four helix bundle protein [Bacteroidota bacterium]
MRKPNVIVEKTFEFSLSIIELFKSLQAEKEFVLSRQLLRSATSIGANINEAISAESKKDFIHKFSISLKEARESEYWLRLLEKSNLTQIEVGHYLNEVRQIIKIISSIILTSKRNL